MCRLFSPASLSFWRMESWKEHWFLNLDWFFGWTLTVLSPSCVTSYRPCALVFSSVKWVPQHSLDPGNDERDCSSNRWQIKSQSYSLCDKWLLQDPSTLNKHTDFWGIIYPKYIRFMIIFLSLCLAHSRYLLGIGWLDLCVADWSKPLRRFEATDTQSKWPNYGSSLFSWADIWRMPSCLVTAAPK